MKTNILDFNRLGLLFKRYFAERSRTELIYWGIMMIIFMFIRNNTASMIPLILICGVVYASRFLKEIHPSGKGVAYFLIPASQLEKITVSVVMTSFYFFGMMMITYAMGNILGTFVNNMLANINLNEIIGLKIFNNSPLQWKLFNISAGSTNSFLSIFGIFLIGQSIYMLGSIYFKNNPFLLTLLVFIAFLFFISIVLLIELKIFYGVSNIQLSEMNNYERGKIIGSVLECIVWLIPPFLWVVSYFRLTEKQV